MNPYLHNWFDLFRKRPGQRMFLIKTGLHRLLLEFSEWRSLRHRRWCLKAWAKFQPLDRAWWMFWEEKLTGTPGEITRLLTGLSDDEQKFFFIKDSRNYITDHYAIPQKSLSRK